MDFSDRVALAAMLAFFHELQEEEKHQQEEELINYYPPREIVHLPQFDPNRDNTNAFKRICNLVQELFTAADIASGAKSDASAVEVIPHLFAGRLIRAIKDLPLSNQEKIQIFDFACNYSIGQYEFIGVTLFTNGYNQLTDAVLTLSDQIVSMIMAAANTSNNFSKFTGFVSMFAEHLEYLAAAIHKRFLSVRFIPKLSVSFVEYVLDLLNEEMRQLERENPELLVNKQFEKDSDYSSLLTCARASLSEDKLGDAKDYYGQLYNLDKNNWEAVFYKDYCSIALNSLDESVSMLTAYCDRLTKCICMSIPLAKKQLFTRIDIMSNMGSVTTRLIELASKFFALAMNDYRANSRRKNSLKVKYERVSAIINMLFEAGNCIEATFIDDPDICQATTCACWKIAIECYENCNMPVPENAAVILERIQKYDPSFYCKKSVIGTTKTIVSSSRGANFQCFKSN